MEGKGDVHDIVLNHDTSKCIWAKRHNLHGGNLVFVKTGHACTPTEIYCHKNIILLSNWQQDYERIP